MLCPVECEPVEDEDEEDALMNPVAVAVVRERVGISLDIDCDIEGGVSLLSDIECDGLRMSTAEAVDGVGGRSGLENAESEVMLSDIDRRLTFFDFRDAVGDDVCESVIDRMWIRSLSGIV
jgi:hypothetical protein